DRLSFSEALAEIERLVDAGNGGSVFTPNVDHVVLVETDLEFRAAYQDASISLPDGQPLVWMSRMLGLRLPERIAGSDLVVPLMQRAATRNWGVYLLGAGAGVADAVASLLQSRHGVRIVGIESPTISRTASPDESAIVERLRAAKPELLLAALGSPK